MADEKRNESRIIYEDDFKLSNEDMDTEINLESLIFRHLWLITRCIMSNPDKIQDAVSSLEIPLSPYIDKEDEFYQGELTKINNEINPELEEKKKRMENANRLGDKTEGEKLMGEIRQLKIKHGKQVAKLLVKLASRKGFYPKESIHYEEI